jgi:quercetin dioxygenase-like cupin family protein
VARRAHFSELPSVPSPLVKAEWKPVRHHLGISAFGTNAYVAEAAGELVIEAHSEDGGFEELYVVLSGRADFEVDDEHFEAPAGTLIFVEPEEGRSARALEAGTAILAVGAVPGKTFTVSDWESNLLR